MAYQSQPMQMAASAGSATTATRQVGADAGSQLQPMGWRMT